MDREQIEALHGQASEAYLAGDYVEALRVWERLLAEQPDDERAQEGIRLCRMMAAGSTEPAFEPEEPEEAEEPAKPAEPAEPAESASAPARSELTLDFDLDSIPRTRPAEIESEVDRGLSALDATRQSEGIDLGDDEDVEPIALGGEVPVDEPRRGLDGINDLAGEEPAAPADDPLEGEDLLAAGETEETGLAAVTSNPLEAAAMELQARVQELLAEARHAIENGDLDEARTIVERICILDDDNAEALVLKASIDGASGNADGRVEDLLAEGAQLFGREEYEQARDVFSRVLAVSPSHAEAEHYLEKIDAMLAGGGADASRTPQAGEAADPTSGLSHEPQEQEPGIEGLPLAGGRPATAAGGQDEGPLLDEPVAGTTADAARPASSSKRLLLIAAAVAVLGVGGWFGVSSFLGGDAGDEAAAAPVTRAPRVADAQSAETAPAEAVDSAPAPELPMDPVAMRAALERARAAYERGDFEQAVLAYNEVLRYDPAHAEARAGLGEAGERFRAQKAESDKLLRAREAFNDRAYSSALKLLYRMPDSVDPGVRDANIVSGWFNLGVIELKGGDCSEAIRYFDEALAMAGDDQDLLEARVFAESFRDEPKDARYFRAVESMPLREWVGR